MKLNHRTATITKCPNVGHGKCTKCLLVYCFAAYLFRPAQKIFLLLSRQVLKIKCFSNINGAFWIISVQKISFICSQNSKCSPISQANTNLPFISNCIQCFGVKRILFQGKPVLISY